MCFLNQSRHVLLVQHTLDGVAAKRLPRAMLEDSSVNVIRLTAHLASDAIFSR